MNLKNVTIQGKLSETFPLFNKDSIMHADEIRKDNS